MAKEYVWHCNRARCGAIVHKTSKPFIMDGTFRCKHCNCLVSADDLMKANLDNLRHYVADMEKELDRVK